MSECVVEGPFRHLPIETVDLYTRSMAETGHTPRRRRRWRWLFIAGIVVLAGWYAFTWRGILIFGLRDDYRRALPYQVVPAGLTSLRAEACGQCHQAIYEEWKSSMHAHAYVDPFFQAYWRKDQHIWVCLNCHSPLENQQPLLIKALKHDDPEQPITEPNPNYDADYQGEGISCAACHVRDGVILGPFEDSVAPHPTRYDPRFRSTQICYTCHQVQSGALQFYNGGPCATFFEFEGGPYAKRGYVCQNCHMPTVERPVANGGPVRQGRQHLWRGGHSPEMIKRALQAKLIPPVTEIRPGEEARFRLHLTNGGAGHSIPTGDPDRYFHIELEIKDGDGRVVSRQSHTISRWIIWRPVIIEVFQNRIPPLQSRDYSIAYRMPDPSRAGKMTIHAKVSYHILTERAYQKLKDRYGLTEEVPHDFTIYEEEVPLTAYGATPVDPAPSVPEMARLSLIGTMPCGGDLIPHTIASGPHGGGVS